MLFFVFCFTKIKTNSTFFSVEKDVEGCAWAWRKWVKCSYFRKERRKLSGNNLILFILINGIWCLYNNCEYHSLLQKRIYIFLWDVEILSILLVHNSLCVLLCSLMLSLIVIWKAEATSVIQVMIECQLVFLSYRAVSDGFFWIVVSIKSLSWWNFKKNHKNPKK